MKAIDAIKQLASVTGSVTIEQEIATLEDGTTIDFSPILAKAQREELTPPKYKYGVVASKDADQYELHVMVPEDWTQAKLQEAVRAAKAALYTKNTHLDEYDADDICDELSKRGVIAATTTSLDSSPVVWDQWKDSE